MPRPPTMSELRAFESVARRYAYIATVTKR